MRTIYYTASDNGDGSVSVSFYDSGECIDLLEKHDPESYRGEGGGSFCVDGEISGITVETRADVAEHIKDMFDIDIDNIPAPESFTHRYAIFDGENEVIGIGCYSKEALDRYVQLLPMMEIRVVPITAHFPSYLTLIGAPTPEED